MNSVNRRSKAPPPSRSLCISLFAATSIDPRLTEGSFRNDDDNDDVSKNVAIKETTFFSDFVAVSPTRPTCDFSVNFPGIEFLETNKKKKRKK